MLLIDIFRDICSGAIILISSISPGGLSSLTSSKMMHPLPLSSVYTWGSGISTPLRLPMLNTEVIQVSLGRTQKMGVTKSGRLITWEVWCSFFVIWIEYESDFIAFSMSYAVLTVCQAPLVGSGEPTLPGAVEQMQPQFISRFLEGQSGVTIKSVSCGDLFTTCLTGVPPRLHPHEARAFPVRSFFWLI